MDPLKTKEISELEAMLDDPISGAPSPEGVAAAKNLLRRAVDRETLRRLAVLECRVDDLEKCISTTMSDIKVSNERLAHTIDSIAEKQRSSEPVMKNIQNIVGAGMVIRWIVMFIVGTLAAIGAIATSVEAVKKWFL